MGVRSAFHLDGEGYDLEGSAEISIVPKSLLVMAPKAYAESFAGVETETSATLS